MAKIEDYVPTREHDGLPVSGYRPQSGTAIALVNKLKALEERVLRELDELLLDYKDIDPDKRWLATGRTDIEKGFMAVNRSIFKPSRIALPEDAN